jgi:DMSO/TMAO reductase YedYZ heme-binding membrane subunit
MGALQRSRVGPVLVLVNMVMSLAIAATVLAIEGVNPPALITCIRVLTPIGMLYFVLAFISRPLHDSVDNPVTRWLVANRRYLGLSFASWHLPHWPILAAMISFAGLSLFWDIFGYALIPATVILMMISVMAATSSDRAQRLLGTRLWSIIHLVGVYAIWFWAFQIYVNRVPDRAGVHDYIYIGLLGGALVFRWSMAVRRIARRRTARG